MAATLKKRIMRRVYTIWLIRKTAPVAGEVAGIGVLGLWGLRYVSPVNILTNSFAASGSIRAFIVFYQNAFFHLTAPAQLSLIAGIVLTAVVFRDARRHLERIATFRHSMLSA